MQVKNKNEAMNWFLEHSSGSVACVGKDGESQQAESYIEALDFFNEHGEQ